MRCTRQTSYDGVSEQLFTLGEIPGVLWTPEGATGPRTLILMGHGGGQHKQAPGIVSGAFDAFGSAEKTLHANPGKHGEIPAFELDSTLRFFDRHLGAPPATPES